MEKLERMGAAGEASLSRQHADVSQKMNSLGVGDTGVIKKYCLSSRSSHSGGGR